MKENSKFYQICYCILIALSTFVMILLSVSSLIFTSYFNPVTYEQTMTTHIGNIPFALLFLVAFFGLSFFITFLARNSLDRFAKILLIATCIYAFLFTFIWTVFSKVLPTSDASSVYQLAVAFAKGDLSAIVPRDSYLACYPHQLSLVFFYQLVFRLIPLYDFRVLQCLNIPFILLFIISCYQITKLFFARSKVCICYLLLVIFCLPLYFYAPNVYGDIPSMGFISFGVWMLFSYFRKNKPFMLLLSVLSLVLSVIVRENSLIFVIAIAICWFLHILKEKNKLQILWLILMLLFCFLITPCIKMVYENAAQSSLGAGIPSSAHIAMGLQDGGPIAPGWYNGYNFDTFIENDYDASVTSIQCRESIKASLQNFVLHPFYAISFFGKKFVTQWTEPTYHFLLATHTSYGDRLPVIQSIFEGKLEHFVIAFSDYYQFTLFIAAFLFLLLSFRRKSCTKYSNAEELVFFIALIGGLIFHTFWEGKARYVMPYCIFLLPYAAAGLELFTAHIFLCFTRRRKK